MWLDPNASDPKTTFKIENIDLENLLIKYNIDEITMI